MRDAEILDIEANDVNDNACFDPVSQLPEMPDELEAPSTAIVRQNEESMERIDKEMGPVNNEEMKKIKKQLLNERKRNSELMHELDKMKNQNRQAGDRNEITELRRKLEEEKTKNATLNQELQEFENKVKEMFVFLSEDKEMVEHDAKTLIDMMIEEFTNTSTEKDKSEADQEPKSSGIKTEIKEEPSTNVATKQEKEVTESKPELGSSIVQETANQRQEQECEVNTEQVDYLGSSKNVPKNKHIIQNEQYGPHVSVQMASQCPSTMTKTINISSQTDVDVAAAQDQSQSINNTVEPIIVEPREEIQSQPEAINKQGMETESVQDLENRLLYPDSDEEDVIILGVTKLRPRDVNMSVKQENSQETAVF